MDGDLMAAIAPGAVYRPVRARTERRCDPELGLIVHCQQGNNSPYGWFQRKGSKSSSTFWIAKDGDLEQYVDLDRQYAWAHGAGNDEYLSAEFEGWVHEPLTAAQIETAAALYEWGTRTRGWRFQLSDRPGQKGLGWHGMGAAAGVPGWGHPDCPGPIRRGQRTTILDRAAALARRPLKSTEDDVMNAEQEKTLTGLLKTIVEQNAVIIGQLGGDWKAGQWPGLPQLGGKTLVDGLAEVIELVGALPEESRDALLETVVRVRDPKTGQTVNLAVREAFTRASEAAEARQLIDGTVPPGLVNPTR